MRKMTMTGRKGFSILAFLSPILYLLMYCPIWNGKELVLSDTLTTALFVFQCVCLVYVVARLFLEIVLKRRGGKLAFVFDLAPVFSIILTCFYGFIFVLELLGVPWFPAQT